MSRKVYTLYLKNIYLTFHTALYWGIGKITHFDLKNSNHNINHPFVTSLDKNGVEKQCISNKKIIHV